MLVGAIGFEPTTLWSQTRCATRLRYTPINRFYPHKQLRLEGMPFLSETLGNNPRHIPFFQLPCSSA